MAARSERTNLNTEEGKIPVFTVLKNNAILKNIFIVNKPPEELLCSSNLKFLASVRDQQDVLIVGRHPDCNIILTHPSISRFHLRIRSKPSSQELSVVDLSSVHGTWVSERKLDPGVSVDLKEGDTLRIGGSSRVYRLHWIPISVAYDLENPFVLKLDVAEETRQEDAVREKEIVEIVQDEESSRAESEIDSEGNRTLVEGEKFCSVDDEEIQSLASVMDCTNSLLPDEKLELTMKKKIPSVPTMVEEVISLIYDEEGKKPLKDDHQQRKSVGFLSGSFETEPSNFHATSESEKPPHLEMVVDCNDTESNLKSPEKMSDFSVNLESQSCMEQEIEAYPEAEKPRESKILNTLKEHLTENICLSIADAVQRTKIQFQDAIDVPPNTFTSQSPPGNPEASLEKHWFGLMYPDPASLDQNSAVEMPKEAEFGWKLRKDERVKDIVTAEAGKLITECMPPVEEAIPEPKLQQVEIIEDVTTCSLSDKEKQNKFCPENDPKVRPGLSAKYCQEQGQSMDEKVQDIDNKHTVGINPVSPPAASINSSLPDEAILEMKNKKENQSPLSLAAVEGCSDMKILESHVQVTQKILTSCNLWSRRGKAASPLQIGTSKRRVKGIASVYTEVQMSNEKDTVNKAILQDFCSVLDEEEEMFAPDKENFRPNTLQLRFQKNKGKLEEIKHFKFQRLHNSKVDVCANIYPGECMSPTSNKENQTLKVAQGQNPEIRLFCSHIKLEHEQDVVALKNRVKSVPIQSLLMPAPAKSRSETSGNVSAAKNINASNCGEILYEQADPSHIRGEQEMRWDMVVDSASLLNKESRKSLQLLQGLKGTRLIIPRTVIRKLDIMKQQSSIFRRTSEASLVLEWIEECMGKSKWWIHVQSLADEKELIGLTPPALPQTQSREKSCTFPCGIGSSHSSLSFHENSVNSVSPTDEDYILDCALLYRTKQNNRQLVLLSDDATLKIKSMAEGLLCETVQEFRESLVNPFSQRFLWANSSARGLTWSCQDDVVLREKYCRFPLRYPSKGEGARGLKLILLHNSEYMGRPVQIV